MFQVFVRKSSGKDVVPNFGFWSALPGLIMVRNKLQEKNFIKYMKA